MVWFPKVSGGFGMGRFVEGEDRRQECLLPPSLADYVAEDNPVRVVEAFIDELDLSALGFDGMEPATTGRPAYHPSTMLKIYLHGYLGHPGQFALQLADLGILAGIARHHLRQLPLPCVQRMLTDAEPVRNFRYRIPALGDLGPPHHA
jgi:hypothetical protein